MCRSKGSEIAEITSTLLGKNVIFLEARTRVCETCPFVQWSTVVNRLVTKALMYRSGRDGSAIDSQSFQTSEPNKQEVYMRLQLR